MARMGSEVTVRFSEYRPCMIGCRKAWFHRIADMRDLSAPGNTVKAVVEYENGDMDAVPLRKIRFLQTPEER